MSSVPSRMILSARPLGSGPFATQSPFLFGVYHRDRYPEGREDQSPNAPLHNRRLGMDFSGSDGWSMYHGRTVPGFPEHPHRGFETVTVVREGLVDHHDSLGCQGRFGEGDAQWMTAGRGVSHSEMFPCVHTDRPNPLDLYQIWINLPRRSKMAAPHFTMLWGPDIPRGSYDGGRVEVRGVAGRLPGMGAPPAPPPESWASDEGNEVAIWTITVRPGGSWALPPASALANRSLYFVDGGEIEVAGTRLRGPANLTLRPDAEVPLRNTGGGPAELLLLQGRPIDEPVAQQGPFVMNTPAELMQAFQDYRGGKFGAWPWGSEDPVLPRGEGRFAKYADGRVERPADA